MAASPYTLTRDDAGIATLALTCLLAVASFFFGQPLSIEVHWMWMAVGCLCLVAIGIVQFVRFRNLQRRDDELNAILDTVPHPLFFKDLGCRYRVVNAEFRTLVDIDPLGKSDRELFSAEFCERLAAQDSAVLSSGGKRTFEQDVLVDGTMRTFQARKSPVIDRRGRLRGIVGISVDVTDERNLQRELQTAGNRLDIALEATRLGTWEWNLDTGEIRLDERERAVLGLEDNPQHVSAIFARMHPDDVEEVQRSMDHARDTGEVAAFDYRLIDDAGRERWIEAFAARDRTRSGSPLLYGTNRDITKRREDALALTQAKERADRALAELEQSRVDLGVALRVGKLGVWRSSTRAGGGGIAPMSDPAFLDAPLTADRQIRKIYGLPPDAAVTYRDQIRLLHPDDRERVTSRVRATLRRKRGIYRDQFRICARDGVVRTVDVRSILKVEPEDDRGMLLLSFTGIMKDVTLEEKLKADLVAKAAEARSAVEAKGRFLAMMSHEIRTPLHGMLGMLDLVLDTRLTERQRKMLETCRHSSLELLEIINEILDYSKIQAGKLALESQPLHLAPLIENVCLSFSVDAMRKSITLDFHVDARLPAFIVGDSVRLRQVLVNLVGNAVKFTEHGGVTLEARQGADGRLQLVVEDTGVGIPEGALDSLLEPFRQADVTTTRRYGGTGLGLTIVKQLVDLMGGEMLCESELGRGSRFTVTLPLAPWAAGSEPGIVREAAARPLQDTSPIGQGRWVLLAEDHPVNREVLTMQLAQLGFECDRAEDGEQAWDLLMAADRDYALLLTDCHMPMLDGDGLTRRLREHEARFGLPRRPIIALTANAQPGEAEHSLSVGMDGYLTKPIQLPDLRAALLRVLQNPPAQQPPAAALPYASLRALSHGDAGQIATIVRLFVSTATDDLDSADRAVQEGDWAALRLLAHRMASACRQLDEPEAVQRLQAVETEADAGALPTLYASAREEVGAVIARANEFLTMPA